LHRDFRSPALGYFGGFSNAKNQSRETEAFGYSPKESRRSPRNFSRGAQKGFRKTVIQELEKRLELARAGKRVDQYLRLPEPLDRTRDYDRVISMLKMDLTDTVELSETDYSQYVMDDWEWKREFLGTNQAYSLKAAKLVQNSGDED